MEASVVDTIHGELRASHTAMYRWCMIHFAPGRCKIYWYQLRNYSEGVMYQWHWQHRCLAVFTSHDLLPRWECATPGAAWAGSHPWPPPRWRGWCRGTPTHGAQDCHHSDHVRSPLELQMKVLEDYAKISQSRRRPLLIGTSGGKCLLALTF